MRDPLGKLPVHQPLARLTALAVASGATAGLGLGTLPPLVTGGLVAGWGVLGTLVLGPVSLLATLPPALALLPGGTPLALAGWTCAAAGTAGAAHLARHLQRHARTRSLRHRVRQGEYEQQRLTASISRYPALQEASLALSAVRDMDHLAEVLCRQVRAVVPATVAVQVHCGLAAQLSCRASTDLAGKPAPTEPGTDERYVATEARSLIRRNVAALHVLLPLRGERRSTRRREVLCGVLVAALPCAAADEHLHLELLRALAQLGGIGLAAVDLVGQARALALRDDLTGLFGQHEFLRRLEEQVASARRHSLPLGAVMCDLDHLKKFNDTWGHAAGDAALKAVAKAIREVVATLPGAIACRYGGEEFALCLPNCRPTALADAAERVRQTIAAAIPDAAAPQRRVTASLGIASLRPGENGRALLIRADAATYRAKADGRDRVATADDLGSVDVATGIMPAVTKAAPRQQEKPRAYAANKQRENS